MKTYWCVGKRDGSEFCVYVASNQEDSERCQRLAGRPDLAAGIPIGRRTGLLELAIDLLADSVGDFAAPAAILLSYALARQVAIGAASGAKWWRLEEIVLRRWFCEFNQTLQANNESRDS